MSLAPAGAAAGAAYWRLVKAGYDATVTGRSTIFCEVQNEKGERVIGQSLTMTWPGSSGTAKTENKPAPEFAANFGIGGGYTPADGPGPYTVGVDGLPSDKVCGMGRPQGRDATFYLTWRRTVSGQAPAKSVIRGMVVGGQSGQAVTLRPAGGQPRQTTLDASGAYSFGDLPAGTYSVEVGGASVPNLRVDGSSTLDAPLIDIRPRQSVVKGVGAHSHRRAGRWRQGDPDHDRHPAGDGCGQEGRLPVYRLARRVLHGGGGRPDPDGPPDGS